MPRREQRDVFPVLQQMVILPGEDHVIAEYQEVERDPGFAPSCSATKPMVGRESVAHASMVAIDDGGIYALVLKDQAVTMPRRVEVG